MQQIDTKTDYPLSVFINYDLLILVFVEAM